MDSAQLFIKVRQRLKSDAGVGGLFAADAPLVTGVFHNRIPQNAQMPLLVFKVQAAVGQNAFRAAVVPVTFNISIFVKPDEIETDDDEAYALIGKVKERLYGNWLAQSAGGQPTYGLHNYAPTLVNTNWVAGRIEHVDSREFNEDDALHTVESWRVLLTRSGV